jgi:hypothetical protein
MTLFTHLPLIVIVIFLLFAGTLSLYYTFKVPKRGKLGVSSLVFGCYGLAISFLMLEYYPLISFEKMFSIILIIWVVWFISGVITNAVLFNKR